MLAIRDAGNRAESASRFIAKMVGPNGVPRYFKPAAPTPKPSGKAKATKAEEPAVAIPDDVTTAAALTFYCWRYCIDQQGHETRKAGRYLSDLVVKRCSQILIDGLETDREDVDPYALAMLGRSLVAAWKFCGGAEYLDVAQLVATFLLRHDLLTWNSPECFPHYRKAAGLYKLVARPTAADDIDLRLFGDNWEPPEPEGSVAAKVKQLELVSNLLSSAEGLLMAEASAARAIATFGQVLEATNRSPVSTAILQAQIVRFATVAKVRLQMSDGDTLLMLQDDATGGFHTCYSGVDVSTEYDVLATIFAAQALFMLQQSRLTNWPGTLQKRDLMFI